MERNQVKGCQPYICVQLQLGANFAMTAKYYSPKGTSSASHICVQLQRVANLLPAVDRQPWSPREMTRREGSSFSKKFSEQTQNILNSSESSNERLDPPKTAKPKQNIRFHENHNFKLHGGNLGLTKTCRKQIFWKTGEDRSIRRKKYTK